jgi:four helix bundle protein
VYNEHGTMNNAQCMTMDLTQPHICTVHCSVFIVHFSLPAEGVPVMYKESVLSEKSLEFAASVVKFCVKLKQNMKEDIITKQLIRSSTSIGANISEANYGQSRADFISKMQIALKEAAESEYWLKLLFKADYIPQSDVSVYIEQCKELERILIATLKTAKDN